MTNDELWNATLGELELSLSRANFTTWFKNTFIVSREDDKVVIGVPNTFTKTWFENKYHGAILKAMQHITDPPIKAIEYTVSARQAAKVASSTAPGDKAQIRKESAEIAPRRAVEVDGSLEPKYTFENFVVGTGNELAHAACKAVTINPGKIYNPLFLYGGSGLGKTHLIQAIGAELKKKNPGMNVLYVTCEKFTNDFIQAITRGSIDNFKKTYRSVDCLLIDDIQFLAGKEGTQEEFFHTFNALHQSHRQIVLTSDRPPKAIPALENRLVSRFEWGMMADLQQPNLETRIAILDSKCIERSFTLTPDIVQFIATTIQSNVRELEGALNRIAAYQQLNNIPPTLVSVKELLASVTHQQKRNGAITVKQILNTVASFFELSMEDLKGASRKKELVVPRQISMYLLREDAKSSYPTIGQELGGRDHTTAIHAFEKMKDAVEHDEKIRDDINLIRQRLYANRG
ncbi:MAG: chromosomal replication initiator protein DnaA [Parcubacteria group bacterium]